MISIGVNIAKLHRHVKPQRLEHEFSRVKHIKWMSLSASKKKYYKMVLPAWSSCSASYECDAEHVKNAKYSSSGYTNRVPKYKYGKGTIFEIIKGHKYLEIITPATWSGPSYDTLGRQDTDPEWTDDYIMAPENPMVIYRMIKVKNNKIINDNDEVFAITEELLDTKLEENKSSVVTHDTMLNDIVGLSDIDDEEYVIKVY